MSSIIPLAFLLFLLTLVGTSEGNSGGNLRCKCINKESKPMGRFVKDMKVIPPNSHCPECELIAVLKKGGKEVCVDPDAPWVKRMRKHSGLSLCGKT